MNQERRDTKPRRRRKVGAKREKGEALIIKTEQSKNSDVFKAVLNDAKIVDLGAHVRSIRRILRDDLKRDKKRYNVEVRALTAEVTLKVKKPRRDH